MSSCDNCKGCQKGGARCYLCHSTKELVAAPNNPHGVFFCAKCVKQQTTHWAFKCAKCGGYGFIEKDPETKSEVEGWLGGSLSDDTIIVAQGCQRCDPDDEKSGPRGNA